MGRDMQAEVDRLIDERPGRELLPARYDDTAVPLTEFLYQSSGSTAAYLIVTDGGRVIVNCGLGFEAPHHRRVFDEVDDGPIRYIISTQAHNDHVGGVHAFRQQGTVYVAQQNNPMEQAEDHRTRGRMARWARVWFPFSREQIQGLVAERPDLPWHNDIPTPDLTFDRRLAFTVGSMRFELYGGAGETTDSAIVWLPEQRVALISNLLGPLFPHFPNLNTLRGQKYRFVEPYLASIATLRELRPELLVTGRGEPIRGADLIDAALERLAGAVDYVHRETLAGLNGDKDMLTLMREVRLPPELRVGEGYGKVSWGVRTIWESYLGWFHHRGTAELYPLDPGYAATELVGLAGADAVLTRARELLAAGQAAEATALGEAVLATDPACAEARALLADTHRALLADPVAERNFWQHGWLAHRLRELEEH